MVQETPPAQQQTAEGPPRSPRRIARRQRRQLKRLERQLVGRRRRFGLRRQTPATHLSAPDLEAVIAHEVRIALDAERESIRRETEEEIDRRMEEFTEMMLRRQEKMMARAWQEFSRRARQRRQRATRKS